MFVASFQQTTRVLTEASISPVLGGTIRRMAERSGSIHAVLRLLMQAGVLTAVTDGLFASVSSVFYGSTVARLFQGVASTLLGSAAFEGGTRTALIGIAMHVAVAFGWSAVFVLLVRRAPSLRRALQSLRGRVTIAALYGPLIWLVMSLAVIPLLLHRPPSITMRWWTQLIGHIPFVGVPIVMSVARYLRGVKIDCDVQIDGRFLMITLGSAGPPPLILVTHAPCRFVQGARRRRR